MPNPNRDRPDRKATLVALALALVLGGGPVAALAQGVALTPGEKAWLQQHPVVTLALDQGNPPLNFRRADAEGESFAGASLDYANLIAKKTGVRLRFTGSSWDEALRKAMAHEVDGVMSARELSERKARLSFTEPYLELPIAMVTRPDHAEVRALGDFSGQRIAVVRNTVRVPVIRARCPGCTVVPVDSPRDGIARVAGGGADGFFDDLPVVQRAIGEAGGKLRVALLYYYSEAATVRFALRKDAPELLSIFNKGLAAIDSEEHGLIRSRWLAAAEGARVQRELPLSAEQRAWLAAHPLIRVGTSPTRAPLEWRGEDGEYRGVSMEFLHRIEEMLGVRFEMVRADDWGTLVRKGRAREVDLFTSITETASRDDFLRFTEPYLSTPMVAIAPVGTRIGGLAGLTGKRVAVVPQTDAEDLLRREWPGIERVPVRNLREGVDSLRGNDAVAFVGALLTTTHQLMEMGAADIRVAGEVDYVYRFRMGIRSDWPELAEIIDRALAAIPKAERDAFRQKWSTVHIESRVDYRPITALAFAVLLAGAFILQLRVMVRRRTAELQSEIAVRKAREAEIESLNADLERRVEARTADLTKAHDKLRLAVDQLVQTEKVASLGRLVAGIAHELNTPLGNAITVATALHDETEAFAASTGVGTLRRTALERYVRRCQDACRIIERNAKRGADLIANFKQVAIDQTSARRRRFGLRQTVEEVVLMHASAWRKAQHRVEVDIDPAIDMDSYPGALDQVLSNLLQNALLHAFDGIEHGHVRIGAEREGVLVRLSYSDDGNGIPGEFLNKIFDPFFTTRLGKGGSGLGLHLVHTLVTGVLQGSISVSSKVGAGTRFELLLPLAAPVRYEAAAAAA